MEKILEDDRQIKASPQHDLISHLLIKCSNSIFSATTVFLTPIAVSLERCWWDLSIDLLFQQCVLLLSRKNRVLEHNIRGSRCQRVLKVSIKQGRRKQYSKCVIRIWWCYLTGIQLSTPKKSAPLYMYRSVALTSTTWRETKSNALTQVN